MVVVVVVVVAAGDFHYSPPTLRRFLADAPTVSNGDEASIISGFLSRLTSAAPSVASTDSLPASARGEISGPDRLNATAGLSPILRRAFISISMENNEGGNLDGSIDCWLG